MKQQTKIKNLIVNTVLLTIPAVSFAQLPPTQWEVPSAEPNAVTKKTSEASPKKVTTMKPITITAPKIAPVIKNEKASVVEDKTPAAPIPVQAAPSVAPTPLPVAAPAPVNKVPEPVKNAVVETPVVKPPVGNIAIKPIYQPQPDVPREMRLSPVVGTVTVGFTVETDGSVSNLTVLATTNKRLNKSTLDAVAKWKFEPIVTKQDTNVEVQFNME